MTTITTAQVLDAIKADYLEHGAEFRYEAPDPSNGCYYRTPVFDEYGDHVIGSEGAAGCFVGRILDRIGVLPPRLGVINETDDGSVPAIEHLTAEAAFSGLGVGFEDPAVHWAFVAAQADQDGGAYLDHVVRTFAAEANINHDDLGFEL